MLEKNYHSIDVTVDQAVCIVTLNRPEARNALGLEMREELKDFFVSVKKANNIKVIVLTGTGLAFSAGGDLKALQNIELVSGRSRLQSGHEMIKSILDLEKPVIAAVNGVAAGAGTSVALACDFIVAAESSNFIQSFIKVGLVPDLGSLYFLPRLVGRHRALEMMLLGEKVSAKEMQNLGVVNRVVKDEEVLGEALIIARKLAENPVNAMGLTKRLTNKSILSDIDETFELEGFAQAMCFDSEDFKEGVSAFIEKRKPQFS
ncbi:enoyl-CoA hydratase/isomerase family protein [Psychrobacillus sp. NPDC096426]|uniref:enoyl-CoA hydratase/isomerase family protein n=1 Tax=Psychrobacillus sp. NPDC096426 TaxID=3364491 RepID=UPI0037F9D390